MLNDVPCMLLMEMFRDMFMFMSIYRWQSNFGTNRMFLDVAPIFPMQNQCGQDDVIILSLPRINNSGPKNKKTCIVARWKMPRLVL